jgi:predicted RNA methylase
MTVTIKHTHEDGTLVYGTDRGDGTAPILKANRFRWFPSIKLWGVAQSRDHLAKRWQIDAAAKALEAAGFDVTVEIDDTPRDVAEVKADRGERLDSRYDRLTAKAGRNMAEGDARRARADEIASGRPFGQPILVGHHSERRARTDQKRIEQNDRAAHQHYDRAERAQRAASVVGDADAYRERPDVIIRRIEKHEAELRKIERDITGRPDWVKDDSGQYKLRLVKPSAEWLAQLEAAKTFAQHQLEADRAALKAHEDAGYRCHSRETIHVGDVINRAGGFGSGTVGRVNAKTVSVPNRYGWNDKVRYEEIRSVECPHQGTTTTVTMPKPAAAKRETPAVVIERPAERPAPVVVDARTEYFPTPPAVVEQMIHVADLEPGMTVLEPSAGMGAIAGPVHALGCLVDCVELSADLARVLDEGCYRQVIRADFLEYGPRDNPAGAEYYDRVMMNPPFSGQADIKHVTHAHGFLKPGGLVVAIMAAGVEFRQDKTAETFRKLVADHGGRIERLPGDAFEGSGANVRTVLVTIPA